MLMPGTNSSRVVRVGCRGWSGTPWAQAYYPEDLPQDWRLAYYANEADCVLVPSGQWRATDADAIAAWADDVGERFRFYLEAGAAGPDPVPPAALGEAFGGWLATAGASGPDLLLPAPSPRGRAWTATGSAVLHLDEPDADLRVWRARFESLRDWLAPYAKVALIVGAGVSPQRVRELRTLADLLFL
jgi:hypothetical protein